MQKRPGPKKSGPFTKREIDVLKLLANFYTYNEICAELDITKNSLHIHITNIKEKTGLNTQIKLAQYAIKHGYGSKVPA